MGFVPERLFIESGLEGSVVATIARKAAAGAPVERFDDLTTLSTRLEALPAEEAKRLLVVARRAGGFVKSFPSGPGIRPSGWSYFIPAIGCPADCRYCFLQTYHPSGAPIVFADREAMLREVEVALEAAGGGYFYGGELCDNLMLERFSPVVGSLVELFHRHSGATLELRTKSDEVGPLIACPSSPNVIVSWTFTPPDMADRYERGTAPTAARIAAAATAQKAGFRVGVRLDPLILTEGWQTAYMSLVDSLARALDPDKVESVHLGALRFTPALKSAVTERFGAREPFVGEFVQSSDGKYRYPRPLRVAAYAEIAQAVKRWSAHVAIRLCMETPVVEEDFRRLMLRRAGVAGCRPCK